MLALTIENFSPELYTKLQEVAFRNHLSITQQARRFLEDGLTSRHELVTQVDWKRDSRKNLPHSLLQAKDLQDFLAQLPELGEDTDAFAEDLRAIRHSLPLEKEPWA